MMASFQGWKTKKVSTHSPYLDYLKRKNSKTGGEQKIYTIFGDFLDF